MHRVEVDRAVPGPHTLFTYDPCPECGPVSITLDVVRYHSEFNYLPDEAQPAISVLCIGCGKPRKGYVYVEVEDREEG